MNLDFQEGLANSAIKFYREKAIGFQCVYHFSYKLNFLSSLKNRSNPTGVVSQICAVAHPPRACNARFFIQSGILYPVCFSISIQNSSIIRSMARQDSNFGKFSLG